MTTDGAAPAFRAPCLEGLLLWAVVSALLLAIGGALQGFEVACLAGLGGGIALGLVGFLAAALALAWFKQPEMQKNVLGAWAAGFLARLMLLGLLLLLFYAQWGHEVIQAGLNLALSYLLLHGLETAWLYRGLTGTKVREHHA
jgi:hypothetical protein